MNAKIAFFERPFVAQMAGPLFLIPALMLAKTYHPYINIDLVILSGLGLALSAIYQVRGFAYVLALLAISSAIKHLFFDSHHLFQLSIEISIALSLLLTSLIFTEEASTLAAKETQMQNQTKSLQFLEEDLTKQKEKFGEEQMALQTKMSELQESLDEMQQELSAIQVLNEVLRKSSAKAIDLKTQASKELFSSESRIGLLLSEIDALQKELQRLSNDNLLAQQNKDLFKELNAARIKENQTHLINETLARMLATQAEKLSAAKDEEMAKYKEQCALMQTLQADLNAKTQELEQIQAQQKMDIASMQEQVSALQAHLALKNQELEQIKAAPTPPQEILSKLLEKSHQTEVLYKQLRQQFAEKDQTLHQTRRQLFTAETELQTIQNQVCEKEVEIDPLPPILRQELEAIEEERDLLAEENLHLTELVSQLLSQPATYMEKKKPQ